jgi:hypothetical protein
VRNNAALEALAVDADGRLYSSLTHGCQARTAFPVYRFDGGAWGRAFRLPARDGFSVAGPTWAGRRLYLLERDFSGLGFRSACGGCDLDGSGEETLLTTRTAPTTTSRGSRLGRRRGPAGHHDLGRQLPLLPAHEIVDYRLPE